jgi:hypothetical protein
MVKRKTLSLMEQPILLREEDSVPEVSPTKSDGTTASTIPALKFD